jgi:hypothetical protein
VGFFHGKRRQAVPQLGESCSQFLADKVIASGQKLPEFYVAWAKAREGLTNSIMRCALPPS